MLPGVPSSQPHPQGLLVSLMEPPAHLVAGDSRLAGPSQEGASAALVLAPSGSLGACGPQGGHCRGGAAGGQEHPFCCGKADRCGCWLWSPGEADPRRAAAGGSRAGSLPGKPSRTYRCGGQRGCRGAVQPAVGIGGRAPGLCVAQRPPDQGGHGPQRAGAGAKLWSRLPVDGGCELAGKLHSGLIWGGRRAD